MPFLHVTTHLDGHPYDDLLTEFGRGGFPSLMFLDAQGRELASPRARTVYSFARCAEALTTIDEVRTRAQSGDEAAKLELVFLEVELRKLDGPGFEERVRALEPSADQAGRERIARARLDYRLQALMRKAYGDEREAALDQAARLVRAGETPGPESPHQAVFWNFAYQAAKSSGDTKLIRLVARGIREGFREGSRDVSLAETLETLAAGLDERDELLARQEGGEAGLEARILLVELRLKAITFEVCTARMEAALAVASEAEATELRQLAVDLEVEQRVTEFWAGGDRAAAAGRLIELYADGQPIPSEQLSRLAVMPLRSHLTREGASEELEAFVGKLKARLRDAPHLDFLIENLAGKE